MFFDLIPDEKVYTEHRPHLKITKPSFSAIITIHGSSVMCFVFSVIYFMTGQTRYTIDQWNHQPVKPKPPYYTSLLDCAGFPSIYLVSCRSTLCDMTILKSDLDTFLLLKDWDWEHSNMLFVSINCDINIKTNETKTFV